ncbi:hypothetical protein NA57DRAFT_59550 [Rhizodiscina lignyota]|uniref:Uncharacterized protein n=1 Tax=Rhizodiscina lignyota TaxID=1504668 RepID=A0A9P4M782_9PEZI|nr:hypothetical protein NA57DRAFT_59550 [Rhizodiscina lignyota]
MTNGARRQGRERAITKATIAVLALNAVPIAFLGTVYPMLTAAIIFFDRKKATCSRGARYQLHTTMYGRLVSSAIPPSPKFPRQGAEDNIALQIRTGYYGFCMWTPTTGWNRYPGATQYLLQEGNGSDSLRMVHKMQEFHDSLRPGVLSCCSIAALCFLSIPFAFLIGYLIFLCIHPTGRPRRPVPKGLALLVSLFSAAAVLLAFVCAAWQHGAVNAAVAADTGTLVGVEETIFDITAAAGHQATGFTWSGAGLMLLAALGLVAMLVFAAKPDDRHRRESDRHNVKRNHSRSRGRSIVRRETSHERARRSEGTMIDTVGVASIIEVGFRALIVFPMNDAVSQREGVEETSVMKRIGEMRDREIMSAAKRAELRPRGL